MDIPTAARDHSGDFIDPPLAAGGVVPADGLLVLGEDGCTHGCTHLIPAQTVARMREAIDNVKWTHIDAATTGDAAEMDAAIREANPDAEVHVDQLVWMDPDDGFAADLERVLARPLADGGFVSRDGLVTLGEGSPSCPDPVELVKALSELDRRITTPHRGRDLDTPASVARRDARTITPPPNAPRVVFRSIEWDGPAPVPGDVISTPWGAYVATAVAAGAGLGHWRVEAYEARLITWDGTRPLPE